MVWIATGRERKKGRKKICLGRDNDEERLKGPALTLA
jgi:hypothetical protein